MRLSLGIFVKFKKNGPQKLHIIQMLTKMNKNKLLTKVSSYPGSVFIMGIA